MTASLLRMVRIYGLPIAIDALIVVASLLFAWSGRSITTNLWDIRHAFPFAALAMATFCIANWVFSLYRHLWRYASAGEVVVIAGPTAISTAILIVADLVWPGRRPVPLSVVLFTGFFSFVGFVAVRYRSRVWSGLQWRSRALRGQFPVKQTRTLVVGAGEAGQLLVWRIQNLKEGAQYDLVGFVDDDPAKVGMRVHRLPVMGTRESIPDIVVQHRVELIVVAILNVSAEALRDILAICERTPARVKVLPNVLDLIQQTNNLPPIRDVTVEDLLGRRPVQIDHDACRSLLAGKTVLVTGAAGSIGSELCRQVLRFGPRTLLMLDNNESGLFDLATELGPAPIRSIIADVTNRPKMEALFGRHRPQIVFHAAAYKHVPLMEDYPDEAVRVNVLGTMTVADLACRSGAERLVFISTDKAVSPTCIMGATKRLGEFLIASIDGETRTLCTGVRFGNVLGSRGSVVPTFQKQIDMGGPVTITHPEMTRYFMSIPEAVSLVIQAATLTQGGDLFILDMGEPVRIEELAERLIRLRGLRPGVDVPIKYTGIRPGEKLHEELTNGTDEVHPTSHPAILRVNGAHRLDSRALRSDIETLIQLAQEQRNGEVKAKLWEAVGVCPAEAAPVRRRQS